MVRQQALLSPLALGDILDRDEHAAGPARLVPPHIALTVDNAHLAVGPDHAVLHVVVRAAPQRLSDCLERLLQILWAQTKERHRTAIILDHLGDTCHSTGDLQAARDVWTQALAILDDIQSGRFARDWVLENKAGQPSFKATRARNAAHPIEEVGERLRAMMPWIAKNKLVDKSRN